LTLILIEQPIYPNQHGIRQVLQTLAAVHTSIQLSRHHPCVDLVAPPLALPRSTHRIGTSPRHTARFGLHRPRACRDSVAPPVPDPEDPRSSPGHPHPRAFTGGGLICCSPASIRLSVGLGHPAPPALLRPKAFSIPMCSLRPSCCARPAQKRSGPAAATATGRPKSSWPTAPG
jgi:hypothetical protein